jgi:hypothetical protein
VQRDGAGRRALWAPARCKCRSSTFGGGFAFDATFPGDDLGRRHAGSGRQPLGEPDLRRLPGPQLGLEHEAGGGQREEWFDFTFAAWLHYGLGLSFAKCATALGRLGIGVTAGALCSGAQRTGTALVPVHAEICRRINGAPAVVMNETGWREGGRGVWLWAATTPEATAYWVAANRPGFLGGSVPWK